MFRELKGRRAASIVEYIMVVVVILTAALMMQRYLLRGFAGMWKSTADSFGQERQFDPEHTTECSFDTDMNIWYDQGCNEQCKGSFLSQDCFFSNCYRPCRGYNGTEYGPTPLGPCASRSDSCGFCCHSFCAQTKDECCACECADKPAGTPCDDAGCSAPPSGCSQF